MRMPLWAALCALSHVREFATVSGARVHGSAHAAVGCAVCVGAAHAAVGCAVRCGAHPTDRMHVKREGPFDEVAGRSKENTQKMCVLEMSFGCCWYGNSLIHVVATLPELVGNLIRLHVPDMLKVGQFQLCRCYVTFIEIGVIFGRGCWRLRSLVL